MDKNKHGTLPGRATVSTTEDHIVLCTLSGYIDEPTVRKSLDDTRRSIELLRAQGRPVYLLIDATRVTGQTTGARSLAKTLGDMGIVKLAVCNRNAALGLVIQYLLRSSGAAKYSRVFRSRGQAERWLLNQQSELTPSYNALRLSMAVVVALISGLALVGWGLGNDFLKAWVPGLKPMNPMAAVVLIMQAVLLLFIKKERLTALSKKIVTIIAGLSFFFGLVAILQAFSWLQVHVDDWLFRDRLGEGVFSGLLSPRVAVLMMLLGIMELAVLTGQRRRWQQYIFHASSVIVVVVGLGSIIGYGFGTSDLYGVTRLLPIPLNTALCVLLLNHALQTVARPLPFFARSWRFFSRYSYTVVICLIIVLLTGVAWHQSRTSLSKTSTGVAEDRLTKVQTTIDDRMNGYTDSLRGYRSFFEASDFVSAEEFQTFFQSSRLAEHYPGFSAISFARAVPAGQRAALEASIREQADAAFPTYRQYTIFPSSNAAVLYPTVYVEPHTPTTLYGFDLATNATRRSALNQARDSGDVTATDTIDLNASRADSSLPKRPGFFITIPVYKTASATLPTTVAERRASLYGFVNAIFEDKILFDDVFKNVSQKELKFTVTNLVSNETLYTYNPQAAHVQKDPIASSVVNVAGQKWLIALYSPKLLGVDGVSRDVPTFILLGGVLVVALTAALTISQTRRREQALALAAAMTEDLNNERDAAVTLQQKDEAILSSIGDAVFAIDTKKRIILFNRAATEVTGVSEEAALGTPYDSILRFVHDKDRSPANQFIQTALSGKQATMSQGTLLARLDGAFIPVADSAAPITNSKGRVEGAVVVFRDVTREKELEHLKDEFVSMASHELRTPMGAIRALSSMILSGDYGHVNKNLTAPLQDIHAATLRLVTLVNDLLNVARIEAGRMKFNLAEVDCNNALRQTVNNLAPLGKEKDVRIAFTPKALPPVQMDTDKVIQVVTNLIGNALKFTDKGSITVAATPQEGSDMVEVTITDTGTGISAQDQAKLFGKFQQISSAQEGRPAGTGLGLYISREIIRKMGGELWIKNSAIGQGTVFAFTLVQAHTAKAKRIKQQRLNEEKLHPDAV
jgi:PAS domain S-box-containing protein